MIEIMMRKVFTIILFLLLAASSLDSRTLASLPDQPLDTYGAIPWENEKIRLDNFAIHLQSNPQFIGHIIYCFRW